MKRELSARKASASVTAASIKALVASLQDITATLAAADPAHKVEIRAERGIDVTYRVP